MTTTTAGTVFTDQEAQSLAFLIYQRFGFDWSAATAAYNRLLQSNITVDDFQSLVGNVQQKTCSHCGHAEHSGRKCPDENYNGYSCRCKG